MVGNSGHVDEAEDRVVVVLESADGGCARSDGDVDGRVVRNCAVDWNGDWWREIWNGGVVDERCVLSDISRY